MISKIPLVKIALVTALSILAVKTLSTLLVYHFFTFDYYLAIVAIAFLLAGYFLFSPDKSGALELKTIRYSLTSREISIFKSITEGKTNKEIALEYSVQLSTVKTHVNNLFTKLKCKNRKEAIKIWDEMARKQLIS